MSKQNLRQQQQEEPEGPDASSSLAQPYAGSKSRHDANRQYLIHHTQVADILNDMVTHLVCTKPEDELDALIKLLEQKQRLGEYLFSSTANGENTMSNANMTLMNNTTNNDFSATSAADALEASLKREKKEKQERKAKEERERQEKLLLLEQQQQQKQQQHQIPSPPSNSNMKNRPSSRSQNTGQQNQAFQRKNIFGDQQQQQQQKTITEELSNYFSPKNTEAASLFDIIAEFCRNDDELFEKQLQIGSLNEETFLEAFNKQISAAGGQQQQQQQQQLFSFVNQALQNNERMLRNCLLLACSELGVQHSLFISPTSSSSSTAVVVSPQIEQILGPNNKTPPSEKAVQVLLSNIEKRIGRTAALKKLLMMNQQQQQQNNNSSSSTALIKLIFFNNNSSSSSLSTSAEIELLLTEFICNAQIVVKILEENGNLLVVSSSSAKQKEEEENTRNKNAKIDLWIQQSLQSIETATRLRDENRKTLMIWDNNNNNKNNNQNNENNNEKNIIAVLSDVSSSSAASLCGGSVESIREFVNQGRGFIRSWIETTSTTGLL